MINLFGELEFKPLKKYGIIIPNYYISKEGKVYSSKTNKLMKPGKIHSKRHGRLEAHYAQIQIPKGLFKDYEYYGNSKHTCKMTISFHRCVMEVWKPIDENPPIPKEDWEKTPETAKQFIRDSAIVDHIDDDPSNNHVDNLRWLTPKENSCYRKIVDIG